MKFDINYQPQYYFVIKQFNYFLLGVVLLFTGSSNLLIDGAAPLGSEICDFWNAIGGPEGATLVTDDAASAEGGFF